MSHALASHRLAIHGTGGVGARRDRLHVIPRITEPRVHRILACIRAAACQT